MTETSEQTPQQDEAPEIGKVAYDAFHLAYCKAMEGQIGWQAWREAQPEVKLAFTACAEAAIKFDASEESNHRRLRCIEEAVNRILEVVKMGVTQDELDTEIATVEAQINDLATQIGTLGTSLSSALTDLQAKIAANLAAPVSNFAAELANLQAIAGQVTALQTTVTGLQTSAVAADPGPETSASSASTPVAGTDTAAPAPAEATGSSTT